MKLYLLAISLPEAVDKRVEELGQGYEEFTRARMGAHVTIYPPFELKKHSEEELMVIIAQGLGRVKSQMLTFDHIGYFHGGNNVCYLEGNSETQAFLKMLSLKVVRVLEKTVEKQRPISEERFHPHVTIAKRLPEDKFKELKEKLKGFADVFITQAKSLDLYRLEGEGEGRWVLVKKFRLAQ